MSKPLRSIVFIDEVFDWKTDKLYEFIYKFENVPLGYEEFFNRSDVIETIKILSYQLYEAAQSATIFPRMEDVFKAFRCREPKVLLLGQDPYFNPDDNNPRQPGSAIGLCFSLPKNSTYINPSFQSIQKEVSANGFSVDKKCGDISRWVDEGVLLLNSALTVEKNDAGSHTAKWVEFTEKLIEYLSSKYDMTYLLWGRDAHSYESNIKNKEKQLILKSSHPMPLSAINKSGGNPAFFGSEFCKKTNKWLSDQGKTVIDWSIP